MKETVYSRRNPQTGLVDFWVIPDQTLASIGRLASSILERHGLNSTLSPEAAVERACDIAEAAAAEYQKRGWMLDIPNPDAPKETASVTPLRKVENEGEPPVFFEIPMGDEIPAEGDWQPPNRAG